MISLMILSSVKIRKLGQVQRDDRHFQDKFRKQPTKTKAENKDNIF